MNNGLTLRSLVAQDTAQFFVVCLLQRQSVIGC